METAGREVNEISGAVVDAAVHVHLEVGPGLLESAYEACLTHELESRGLNLRCEVPLPIKYKGLELEVGYRLDLLVEDLVVVELKSVSKITDVHKAQLLSYLKLGNHPLGLLLNFHVSRMKDGICRFAN